MGGRDCLAEVVLADFGVRQTLPLNGTVEITITPDKTGEFDFSCQNTKKESCEK